MPDRVTEASLAITWKPHFYRTMWFVALCAALILAAGFFAYRVRLRQVHARFDAVLEERNRIAREMHDTVIQGCASTSALLEAVVSLDYAQAGASKELLDSARNQIRATVDEARRAVWNLRQEGADSREIGTLLNQMALQVSHASRVPVRFEAFGKPMTLDRTVEYVVLMVAREAVYNAVHHAQPHEVKISVHFDPANLRMKVLDDGKGFDLGEVLATQDAHFGLVGMRERVERLGGSFEVKTSPGNGTELSVEVPV